MNEINDNNDTSKTVYAYNTLRVICFCVYFKLAAALVIGC